MRRYATSFTLAQIDDYVWSCLKKHSAPRIKELAHLLDVDRSALSRAFYRQTGSSLQEYLRWRRFECAKELLTSTEMPLDQIAKICGFRDRSGFIRAFKTVTGTTPGRYRARKGQSTGVRVR